MSAQDVDRVLRNGGKLCFNPTDLTAAWPHGGTGLGVVGDVVLQQTWLTEDANAADDRHAGEVVETYFLGELWKLAFAIRQWDDDPVNLLMAHHKAGATRTIVTDQYTGTTARRPGTRLSTSAVKLLFTPEDYLANPAVLFYKAIPCLEVMQEVQLSAMEEQKVAAVFKAMYHQSIGKVYQMGLLSELSLT